MEPTTARMVNQVKEMPDRHEHAFADLWRQAAYGELSIRHAREAGRFDRAREIREMTDRMHGSAQDAAIRAGTPVEQAVRVSAWITNGWLSEAADFITKEINRVDADPALTPRTVKVEITETCTYTAEVEVNPSEFPAGYDFDGDPEGLLADWVEDAYAAGDLDEHSADNIDRSVRFLD